jgi:ABC-type xylose transport system permease subunit
MNEVALDRRINAILAKKTSGWCLPLYIYIFLAVLQLIGISMMKMFDKDKKEYKSIPLSVKLKFIVINIIWNIIVGLIMYYLCKNGYSGWSWFILLLPTILNFIYFIFIYLR